MRLTIEPATLEAWINGTAIPPEVRRRHKAFEKLKKPVSPLVEMVAARKRANSMRLGGQDIGPTNPLGVLSFLFNLQSDGKTPIFAVGTPNQPGTCNGTYKNTLSVPMYIIRGIAWCGVSKDNRGDVSFGVTAPNVLILPYSDDHYDNRNGIPQNDKPFDFAPAYCALQPGEELTATLTSNCDADTQALVAQLFVFGYFVI